METIKTEIINGRKTTFVRYTEEEKAKMLEKAKELKKKLTSKDNNQ